MKSLFLIRSAHLSNIFEITHLCDTHYNYYIKRNPRIERHRIRRKLKTQNTKHQSRLLNPGEGAIAPSPT